MELLLHERDLVLKHPFTIAYTSTTVQRTLIVELRDAGLSGFGEATENSYYGVTIELLRQALKDARPQIESCDWTAPAEFWQAMQPALGDLPFAQCALDEAAYDLWGKRLGRPVYELWGLDPAANIASDYTLGIDSVERMVEKLQEFAGWPIYKIKMGTQDDLHVLQELRRHTDAVFRVDANTGWTVEQTLTNARAMQALGVEFIEQPLPADDWEGMRRVYAESALPIVADESCIVETDVAHCQGFFHGVNIKLTKCGGLTPARRMIDEARRLGLKVMVGCMLESTVGISAIAQLVPLLDYVDMDGPVLLAQDIATGVRVERGAVIYPEVPGTGVRLITDSQPVAVAPH